MSTELIDLDISERRGVMLVNETEARLRLVHGITMTPDAQLQLYHWIKNGRVACPGGECCKEDGNDNQVA